MTADALDGKAQRNGGAGWKNLCNGDEQSYAVPVILRKGSCDYYNQQHSLYSIMSMSSSAMVAAAGGAACCSTG